MAKSAKHSWHWGFIQTKAVVRLRGGGWKIESKSRSRSPANPQVDLGFCRVDTGRLGRIRVIEGLRET